MNFLEFMNDYGHLIYSTVLVVISIVVAIKTGDFKNFLKIFDKIVAGETKPPADTDYEITNNKKGDFEEVRENVKGQKFSRFKNDYRFNKKTKEIEPLDTKTDVQALIDSHAEDCLNSILNRLMPTSVHQPEAVKEHKRTIDVLDELAVVTEKAENYKKEYNMPADTKIEDIYAALLKISEDMKSKLNTTNKGGEKNAQSDAE